MLKSAQSLLLILFIISCSNKEQKKYDKVNVISSDKTVIVPKSDKLAAVFPLTVNFEKDLIIETEDSDVRIEGIEGNQATFEYIGADKEKFNGTFYQGNGQIIVKENELDTLDKMERLLICKVPLKVNAIIKNKYGDVSVTNLNGTIKIECPNGGVKVENSSSALSLNSKLGSFDLVNWHIMGRSKIHTSSGNIKVTIKEDIAYPLELHSGSGNIAFFMQGNAFKTNTEILSFENNQNVFSEFKIDSLTKKYSNAIDITYDRRVIHKNHNLALTRISTGNGRIQLKK